MSEEQKIATNRVNASFRQRLRQLWSGQHNPLNAGGWSTLSFIISSVLAALLYLPLSRLLKPADFGLFAEATVVYSGLTLVVELTLIRALVRAPGNIEELAQATFWLSAIVGLLGSLVCLLVSFPVAAIYQESRLIPILFLLAPGVLLVALGSVPFALLSRQLNFRRRLLPESLSVGLGAIVALAAALSGAGVYSLVIYPLVRASLNSAIAWKIAGWKPSRRRPEWATVKRLLAFGVPASGGELTLYARFNVDYAIGGKLLGAEVLGVYSLAWSTSDRPALLINSFFGNVGYATFARLGQPENKTRLGQVYLSATRLIAALALPIFSTALLLRENLVAALFDSRWQGMVGPLLPLLILQALWVIFYPSVSLVLALRDSRIYALVNTASLALTIVGVLIGTTWGATGVAWAMLISVGLTSLVWGGLACSFLRFGLVEIWNIFKLPFLLSLICLGGVLATQGLLGLIPGLSALLRLTVAVVVVLLSLGLTGWRVWPELRHDLERLREKLPEENSEILNDLSVKPAVVV